MVLQALQAAPPASPELSVRINAPSAQRALAEADLEVVLQSAKLQTVVLPKVESVEDISLVAQYAAKAPDASATSPLSLILSVESASSLLRMHNIVQEAQTRLASEFGGTSKIAALLFARYAVRLTQ